MWYYFYDVYFTLLNYDTFNFANLLSNVKFSYNSTIVVNIAYPLRN